MDVITEPFARRFLAAYLTAWSGHEPDRLLALAAEDVRWDDPSIPSGGVAVGKEAVRPWLVAFWTPLRPPLQ